MATSPDTEKAGAAEYRRSSQVRSDTSIASGPTANGGADAADAGAEAGFATLKPTTTVLSTRSAREAAHTLQTFETSPDNPRNWSKWVKWRVTLTVALTGFISTCGSSIAVPPIYEIMREFHETNDKIGVLITACYVLGLGVGPFAFAPMSELYGRQVAYLVSQTCYVLFSMSTAVAPNLSGMIVLRFLCGCFASVGPALGVATCADLFEPQERARPISVYAVGPMAGPVLGSMLGYWVLFAGWRWVFGVMTLMTVANWMLLVTSTRETYAPIIQKKLQYLVHHPQADVRGPMDRISPRRAIHNLMWMKAMVTGDQAREIFRKAFSRPPRLLFTNPVCTVFCLYYAYIYGIIYVFIVSIPLLFGRPPLSRPGLFAYEWPQATVGLGYCGMAVGFLGAALTAATQQDRIYKRLSRRNGDNGQPEYRLVLTQTGMLIMPVGLFIFAWTAHAQTHWIGPMAGQAMIAYGLMLAFNSIQNFLVDAFFPYSAAATAAATAARSISACILPIFSAQMFTTLGWGWGGTLLGLIALIAVPAPLVMWKFGRQFRERFKFHG